MTEDGLIWVFAMAAGLVGTPAYAIEEAVIADRIVAVVGERVVLTSDLRLEESFRRVDPSPVPLLRATGDPLQDAIDRAIIRGLAGSTAIYAPSDAEVQARVARIRSNFKDDIHWQRFLDENSLDRGRLTGILYSRMVVESYVLRNVSQSARAEDPLAYYREWIARHRAHVTIRLVPRIDTTEGP